MGQGGIIVDDTRRLDGQIEVTILGKLFLLSNDLHFTYTPDIGELVDLSGLTSKTPVASILNRRPTEITVTEVANDGTSKIVLQQAEATTIQVSTANSSITLTREDNLVRIDPSDSMREVTEVVIQGNVVRTAFIFTLPNSGAGSRILVDDTSIGCPGTSRDFQTDITFII